MDNNHMIPSESLPFNAPFRFLLTAFRGCLCLLLIGLASTKVLASGSFAPGYADLIPVEVAAGEHPRLFFGPGDLPDLPTFVAQHGELAATRDLILDADNRDLWVTRAQNYGYAYWLTGQQAWADKARDVVLAMIADTSRWELDNPRALTAGADIWSVAQAYDACANAWTGQTVPSSVTALIRNPDGLQSVTRSIPAHYVGRDLKEAVSEALARNSFILLYQGTGSGWPGDGKTGNNWFAWRYGAALLGLLATDHETVDGWDRETGIDDAVFELRKYLNSKYTTSTTARGWDPEGHGYNFYPGMVMWPAAYALKRLTGLDLLADYPGAFFTQWSTLVSTVATGSTDFNMPIPGIHPDFSDDNTRSAFLGTASLGLGFVPEPYLGGYRFMFDRLVGPFADPMHQRYDFEHGGGIWTLLFYPTTTPAEDPALVWNNAYYDPSFGIAMFRNRFQDRDDTVFMATANLRGSTGGHSGLDELTFRLIAHGEPWITGAGRTQDVRFMPHVFPLDPLLSQAAPPVSTWGQAVEDIYQRGNGDGIFSISTRLGDTGARNHRRKLMVDYSGATGAGGFFLIHDTSDNGTWWRLPVLGDKTLAIDGNTFTFTSPDTGARLRGKILHPAAPNLLSRSLQRVESARWMRADGSIAESNEVTTIDLQAPTGEFLVALFLESPGQSVDLSQVNAVHDGAQWVVDAAGTIVTATDESLEVATWNRPEVSLTAPAAGTAFTGGPQEVVLEGTAAATGGTATLDRVEVWDSAQYLGNATLIGTSWSFSLGNLDLGNYANRFYAIAYDSDGNYRQSPPAAFTVSTSLPPVLHLGSPSFVSYNRWPDPVTVSGVATDPDGFITEVRLHERHNGEWIDLGTATLNPQRGTWSYSTSYTATHNPKPIGRHTYRVTATDNSSDQTTTEATFTINRQFGPDLPTGDEAAWWTNENTAFHVMVGDRVDGSEVLRLRQRPEGGSSRADLATLHDEFLDADFRLTFDAKFEDPDKTALVVGWGNISISLSSHMPDNPPTGWPHDYIMDPTDWRAGDYVLGKKEGNPHIAIDMSFGERNLYQWGSPLIPDTAWHTFAIERVDQTLRIEIDDTVIFENGPGTNLSESPYFAQAGYLFVGRMWHDFPESIWIDNIHLERLSGNAPPKISLDAPVRTVGRTPPFDPVVIGGTVSDDESVAHVEIWSGGTFWGYADVVDGQWSFSFTPPNFGSYALFARAQDHRGAQSYSGALNVHAYHPDDAAIPDFSTEPPANLIGELGSDYALTVTVTGHPRPEIQWFKDGVALPGQTGTRLSLDNFHPDDRGVYTVRLVSPLAPGGVWSAGTTVSGADPRPPEILTQPADTTRLEGLPVQLSVAADGDPAPTFQWYKNGRLISGATTNSLSFPAVTLADTGAYTVEVTNAYGSVGSDPAGLTVTQADGLLSRVAYAGGETAFHEAVALADGSLLIAGSSNGTSWLPGDVPIHTIDGSALPPSSTSRLGLILHVEGDLSSIRACYALPANRSEEIRRIRFTTTPGQSGGLCYISGQIAGGHFIGRLNAHPESAIPSDFDWVIEVPSSEDHRDIQPWDVDASGNVVYLQGGETSYDADPDLQPVIRFLDANGQPRVPSALRSTVPGEMRFPRDLRSWTEADRTAVFSDGNGQIRMGTWPLDIFTTHQIDDATGDPDGINPVRLENNEAYGYTGYHSAGKYRVGSITIDRRTGRFHIGFNTNSRFWDAPANKVQPDFEPAVAAFDADGSLLWWSRLYHEVIDANNNGQVDSGETRLSPPDQYIDSLAVDYSQDSASGNLVVLARTHGNAVSNLWNGDEVAIHPGEQAFHNRFTGTEGNIHISWVGKLALADGTLRRATYMGGFFRKIIDGKGNWPSIAYEEDIHDGWPTHNAGWPDLTTTMATPNSLRVDNAGRIYVVGRGPRMVTTSNAYQKLPRRLGHSNPVLDEGTAPWNAFVRVYQPDLKTLAYSSAVTGDWNYPTGNRADEPVGADNTVLHGVLPLTDGLLITGIQENQGHAVPVINPADWQESTFTNETGLLARLAFQPPQYFEVSYAVLPESTGTVAGSGSYLFGETATLTASPVEGYRFTGWSGDVVGTESTLTILVDAPVHVVAHFEAIPPASPVILNQPLLVEVAEGEPASLGVTVEAYPSPTFEWAYEGTPLPNSDANPYIIPSVALADAGSYTVTVTNSEGAVTSAPIQLAVVQSPEAPLISSHPSSRVVAEGEEVVLSVTATGTPDPTYSWERNGAPLAGESTASLSFTASPATAGSYRVRVSNIAGEVLSNAATVAVLPQPIPGQLEAVVDWQGDLASGTYGLDRYADPVADDFGDGYADWGVRRAEWSLDATLAPSRRYDRNLPSARFYGGVESWRFGVYNTARAEVVDNGTRDQIRFFDSNASNRHLFASLLWIHGEFLNGFDAVPVSLTQNGALVAVIDLVSHGFAKTRFLVKAGGSVYISEASQSAAGVFSLSGQALADAMWAPYDPAANLQPVPGTSGQAQADQLTYDVPTSLLGNVEAVGLFHERYEFPNGGNPEFRLSQFTAMLESQSETPPATTQWLNLHFADLMADPEADPALWAWDGDPDNDGLTTFEEFLRQTDPRNTGGHGAAFTFYRNTADPDHMIIEITLPTQGSWDGGLFTGDGYTLWFEDSDSLAPGSWDRVTPAAVHQDNPEIPHFRIEVPFSGSPVFFRRNARLDP
jgi:hypothetical protein